MTKDEKNYIRDYFHGITSRINRAREEIDKCNYGRAKEILSEAYPGLILHTDEE